MIYRGYDIVQDQSSKWFEISHNGKLIMRQASEEQAQDWIDAEKRRARKQAETGA